MAKDRKRRGWGCFRWLVIGMVVVIILALLVGDDEENEMVPFPTPTQEAEEESVPTGSLQDRIARGSGLLDGVYNDMADVVEVGLSSAILNHSGTRYDVYLEIVVAEGMAIVDMADMLREKTLDVVAPIDSFAAILNDGETAIEFLIDRRSADWQITVLSPVDR
jgi:hypothetical protein